MMNTASRPPPTSGGSNIPAKTDPIGYKDGINWYDYVDGDPVNRVDFNGQESGSISFRSTAQLAAGAADNPPSAEDIGNIILAASIAVDVINTPISPGPDVSVAGAAVRSAITKAEGKAASTTQKLSKVEKSTSSRSIGGKFTEKTKIVPGRGPGQSRAEVKTVKNPDGKTIRTQKDSFDRAGKFQGRKPLRGGPEGRPDD
jgi:hypothetical protein